MNGGDVSSERSRPCQEECGINWLPDPASCPSAAWILIPALNCQVESGRVVTKETSNNYRRKKKRVLLPSFPPTFGPEHYADFSFWIKLHDCVLQRTRVLWGLFGDLVTVLWHIIRIGSEILRDFLGAFAKLLGRLSCLSVRASVRKEQLGCHWTDFYEIWYLSIFRKSVLIIVQRDATQSSLLWVSTTPIVRNTQNCNYSLRYWSYFLCSYFPPTWPS